jgi:DNA-binding transcriptional ArsR family regulator
VRSAEPKFDELIHAAVRLRACALLRPVDALTFAVLRDSLDLTAPTLSKHLRALSDAGYVAMDRQPSADRDDDRRVGWVRLTPIGRTAFDGHVAALRQITQPAPTGSDSTPTVLGGGPRSGSMMPGAT